MTEVIKQITEEKLWDLEKHKFEITNDINIIKKRLDSIAEKIGDADKIPFKYHNIVNKLRFDYLSIAQIGDDEYYPIFDTTIQITDDEILADKNSFDMNNNRKFMKDLTLIITTQQGIKEFKNLAIAAKIRLAVLCAIGIRMSFVEDLAEFEYKLEDDACR